MTYQLAVSETMADDKLMSPADTKAFLDRLFPGMSGAAISRQIGAHAVTVQRWRREGMPVDQCRGLISIRLLAVERNKLTVLQMADEFGI